MIDLTKTIDFGYAGSVGNIKKFKKLDYYYKTGRQSSRDFPNLFGIEPLVEVVCSRIGEAFSFNTLRQELRLVKLVCDNKELLTLACESYDYRKGYEEVFFSDLRSQGITLAWDSNLLDMLLLDYIVMNEDRHDRNVVFINGDLIPIFDLGYSLSYDSIRKFENDFKYNIPFANCNSNLYGNSFHNMEIMLAKNKGYITSRLEQYAEKKFNDLLKNVKIEYYQIAKDIEKTAIVNPVWFDQVSNLINWRIKNVRRIFDEME